MGSETRDIATLPARELLRLYRKHLPPGACYFVAEGDGARKISEIHIPSRSQKPEEGVTFGFFEKGFPPADLAHKGVGDWLQRYPFSHHITSTSAEFQEMISSYIRERLHAIKPQNVLETARP